MTSSVRELPTRTYEGADGAELSYLEVGDGRAVVLLHGYLMTAHEAWVRTGVADRLARAGLRAVMPDMRGHGGSAVTGPAAYPPDVLADDGFALIRQLGLEDPDLVGYSMGSVMAIRMIARGARPARLVLGGTGLDPILNMAGRGERHREMLADPGAAEPGTFAGRTDAYLDRIGADRVALRRVLDTFVDTPLGVLGEIEVPVLLLFGEDEDASRGSVEELAAALPRATIRRVPGDHVTSPRSPGFADALVEFLG
jgi:pimeloyl-ACP methyl ester carboxylesterase